MAKKVILGTDIARDAFKTKCNDNFTELYDKDVALEQQINTLDANKVDNSRVLTDVPANAEFTDTITTINGKTGAITKADIVALGIPAQDTNTTYAEITTAEIDAGTSSTLRTITARRLKYLLDKIVALFPTKTSELTNDSGFLTSVTKSDVGLGNVDNVKQATKAEFDAHKADGTQHAKTARFVIGTSTAGWTAADCDYLCDGVDDQVEINQAIQDLPASGGEIIILDGVYNIENLIHIQKPNTKIKGNGKSTVLKRMFNNGINSGYIILQADYITIEDITLDGNRNSFEIFRNRIISTHPTVEPRKTNYSVIKNCFLKDGGGDYAISLDGNYNYVIKNLITNCKGYGVQIYDNENTISQNMIYDCDIGIFVWGSNNLVTSNYCKRGEGLPADYTASQYTIRLNTNSSSNLVTSNLCIGKAPVDGGTSNTLANNKWE